jgi:hypothetical protein
MRNGRARVFTVNVKNKVDFILRMDSLYRVHAELLDIPTIYVMEF